MQGQDQASCSGLAWRILTSIHPKHQAIRAPTSPQWGTKASLLNRPYSTPRLPGCLLNSHCAHRRGGIKTRSHGACLATVQIGSCLEWQAYRITLPISFSNGDSRPTVGPSYGFDTTSPVTGGERREFNVCKPSTHRQIICLYLAPFE